MVRKKYIGIDIGKRTCVVCIMDQKGKVLEETSYGNTVQDITEFAKRVTKKYKGCSAVCESTGNMWTKTFEVLESYGIPIKLANPLKTRAIAEARIKTDKVDAKVLAHLLRADLVATCYVADGNIRAQKQVIRHRTSLVQDRSRAANRLTSMLDKYDISFTVGSVLRLSNLDALANHALESPEDTLIMQQAVRQILYLNEEIAKIEKRINKLASTNDYARRIMSMTGFDAFGALLIALEIDDIDRFETSKKLVSWLGLCPTLHQSGNTLYHGKMRKDTNRRVNWMMIQAATTASFKDDRMMEVYQRAKKNHPYGVAVSHVANKMGTIIWHLLKNKTLYEQRKTGLYSKKLKKIDSVV